ncbi:MAG: NapC/NirT family cytochrome c [Candidatus Methanoperedens sp.]|nr:NapC/NirT family cytochrome c [Candidatus Methanoperedens sp.]
MHQVGGGYTNNTKRRKFYSMVSKLAVAFFIAGMFLIMTEVIVVSGQYEEDISCYHCHSKQVNEFQKSVHFNKNLCTDCHGGEKHIIGTIISVNVMSENFTGVPHRTKISDMCSKCHGKETGMYKESIHWKELEKGVEIAATCTDCHGVHDILSSINPKSLTYPGNVPLMCSGCHENQTKMQAWYDGIKTDWFDTYKKSYHYKAYLLGGKVLATCSDCHENHDIRPAIDPKSAINQANLPATCGKTGCHPGANQANIYGGKVHEEQSVYLLSIDVKKLVTYFYIIMIIFEVAFTLGLIFLGITSNFELRRRH